MLSIEIQDKKLIVKYGLEDPSNFARISKYNLPEQFIRENIDKLDLIQLIMNYEIDMKLREYLAEYFTSKQHTEYRYNRDILGYEVAHKAYDFSIDFLKKFEDYIIWSEAFCSASSALLVENFEHKIDWEDEEVVYYISKTGLSREFIDRNRDRLDWSVLSSDFCLGENFIKRNSDKIVFSAMFDSDEEYSIEIIQKYHDRCPEYDIYQRVEDMSIKKKDITKKLYKAIFKCT